MDEDIDREYLTGIVMQVEYFVVQKISYLVLNPEEADRHFLKIKPADLLTLWNSYEDKLILHHSMSVGMK